MIAVARLAILVGIAGLVPEIATAADGGGIYWSTDHPEPLFHKRYRDKNLMSEKRNRGSPIGPPVS